MPSLSMPTLSSLLTSWRTLVLLLAIANLKALPLAWHVRLFYRMFANWFTPARVQQVLQHHRDTKSRHPLFAPVSIFSRSPLMEIDYNLHKSNSTYFADLDESRTALMTRILIPSLEGAGKRFEQEGHRGRLAVILGSVHTSFHREIKPYEQFEVRSRVLGWDRKWIVIGSWFIRPAPKGAEEVLLASALSKYVVKKGRFTVSPERCFKTAGWLPAPPQMSLSASDPQGAHTAESSSGSDSPIKIERPSVSDLSVTATPDGISAPVPEPAIKVTESIIQRLESASTPRAITEEPVKTGGWDWDQIEKERLYGLQLAEGWLNLDKELSDEFKRV